MRIWFVTLLRLLPLLLLVPLIDQGVKHLLRRRLGSRCLPLGPLVSLQMVSAQVWLARTGRQRTPTRLWILWGLAAIPLTVMGGGIPSSQPFVGLLLGGSLSHALETWWRGSVSDYVCSRWWPAFNLADVAITIGAVGVVVRVMIIFQRALI